jgi:hypothetical protein
VDEGDEGVAPGNVEEGGSHPRGPAMVRAEVRPTWRRPEAARVPWWMAAALASSLSTVGERRG